MNSQHFLVMNLLRVPPLLLHSTHTVPVTSQILINNHLLFFCKEIYWFIISGRLLFQNSQTQKQFRQVLNEPVLKYHDDQHHQHRNEMLATFFVILEEQAVSWIYHFANGFFLFFDVIEKHLTVAEGPVTEGKTENRSELQDGQDFYVQFVVKKWWFAVVVSKTDSLDDIVVDKTEESDGPEDWKSNSMGESAEGNDHDVGVFEIHEDVLT